MSDEKRQTRLLPFRLRRTGARDLVDAEDFSADAELTALLRAWEAPNPSDDLRGRLLADFRASVAPRRPLWRRALSAELRVPLPVAACAALALLVSAAAFVTRPRPQPAPAAMASETSVPEPAVRVVEVPVVRERVVTRTVYVDRRGRAGASERPERPAEREEMARGGMDSRGAASHGEEPQKQAVPAPATEASGGYFTRVDMGDFQPADEVKIRILKRGGGDEK